MFYAMLSLLLYCLVAGSAVAASVDDVRFMTEQYPPYNFEEEDKLQGISVDLLELMLQRTSSKQTREDIVLLPWARGYKYVQSDPGTCLFAMSRTAQRENLFKWVGPISPHTIGLIARKDKQIKIDSVDDLEKYRIGTIRDDIGDQLLLKAGIQETNLERVAESLLNIKKLNRGRIDLWAYGQDVAMWELKANGFNPVDYELVHVLDRNNIYFAFHKDTPDAVLQALQAALDDIKAEGEHQQIVDRYVK